MSREEVTRVDVVLCCLYDLSRALERARRYLGLGRFRVVWDWDRYEVDLGALWERIGEGERLLAALPAGSTFAGRVRELLAEAKAVYRRNTWADWPDGKCYWY